MFWNTEKPHPRQELNSGLSHGVNRLQFTAVSCPVGSNHLSSRRVSRDWHDSQNDSEFLPVDIIQWPRST